MSARIACGIVVAFCAACTATPPATTDRASSAPARGGALVVSLRTDPKSFNRLQATDSSSDVVSTLTQAKLVRINKATQEVEPWLAESWTTSADGRQITLKLRRGVTFSDGHPFTADDVVFTFTALYDERAASPMADAVQTAPGKRLAVSALDSHTLVVTLASPFAPGVRLLDNVPILPRHKLEGALRDGTLAKAWGPSTPVGDLAGLGPFVLTQYSPGQRLAFSRNPHYWRKAADGTALPYLDRLTIEIIPDQNAELLRLGAGQLDLSNGPIPAESYNTLKKAAGEGRVKLLDLGIANESDSLWFNLRPGAFAKDPRAAWIQRDELRRAISMAVDRKAFADSVFLGAAEPVYGPLTPTNKKWYWAGTPKTPHDPAAAKALLATIGLSDRDGDGLLEDSKGQPAKFTLLTQKGRSRQERGAAAIRDDLKKIGITVDVAALEGLAVVQAIMMTRTYDAVYFLASFSDTDPAITQDVWLSSGGAHFWNLAQPSPATDWERRIDELMVRQVAAADDTERKRLFDEVQQILSEHVPILNFAAPRVLVATSSRVSHVTPAVDLLPLLWSPDTLAVAR